MVTSLSELRKNRSSILDKVVKDLDSGGRQEDTRFWKPTRDKAGNGSAIIRFLPPLNGDELPWVKEYSYGFTVNGKWYINLSPSTIGLPDPVMELNGAAFSSKDESQIEAAKLRKRRTQYISNIYIVRDPANPSNDGKVFLFKYGKKILDMIIGKAKPEFEDDTPVQVWDLDEGCNLKIRVKMVSNFPNYDTSEWGPVSSIASSDDEIEKIIGASYRLSEFTKPERFKSYDDLVKDLNRVMNGKTTQSAALRAESASSEKFNIEDEVKRATEKVTTARKVAADVVSKDDDDDLNEFAKMLADL